LKKLCQRHLNISGRGTDTEAKLAWTGDRVRALDQSDEKGELAIIDASQITKGNPEASLLMMRICWNPVWQGSFSMPQLSESAEGYVAGFSDRRSKGSMIFRLLRPWNTKDRRWP